MQEFRVEWCKYPTNYNERRVLFVTAASKADAEAVARDHIERRYGVSRKDFEAHASEPESVPAGTVREN